jgi:hypothetical protein
MGNLPTKEKYMPLKVDKTTPPAPSPVSSVEQRIIDQITQLRPKAQEQSEQFGKHWYELKELVREQKGRFNQLCESLSFPRSTAYFYIKQYEDHLAEKAVLPSSITEMAKRNYLDLGNRDNRVALARAWMRAHQPADPTDADVARIYASTVNALSPKPQKSNEDKAKGGVISAVKRFSKLTGSINMDNIMKLAGEASRQVEADKNKGAKSS